MVKRILIVDDEPDICEVLKFNLELEGHEVSVAEAPFQLSHPLPDLIVLDVMMTPMSGFEWAAQLKSDPHTAHIPIIFCTAKNNETDLLTGFALGSDDYITKPFRISEVKARVRAVLRRAHMQQPKAEQASEHHYLTYEGLTLDMDRKECMVDGTKIPFTRIEFELLALLLNSQGQVLTREAILHAVWPSDAVVLGRTVDVNITRIRKKIGRYGNMIRTKFGYGYMFEK